MGRAERLRQLLEETVAQEVALYDALDEAARERVGTYEAWSARDTLAHCAAWKASLAEELGRAARGEPSRRGEDFDFEAENGRIFAEYEGGEWPAIRALVEGAHGALVEQLGALGEEGLERRDLIPRQQQPTWQLMAGNGVVHSLLHLAEVYGEAGDAKRSAEMVALAGEPLLALDPDPGWQGTVRYNQACGEALDGRAEEALATLREALRLAPELAEYARQDGDLASLRDRPEYEALYE
jgi:hypothetical protein